MGLFNRPKPPSDDELYLNVHQSLQLYLDSLAKLQKSDDSLALAIELNEGELLEIYGLIANTALSNLNYASQKEFKESILGKIPEKYSKLKEKIGDESYLSPPIPQRYVSWIQELLNKAFPIETKFENFDLEVLWYLVTQALMQGNPPRKEEELNDFENKFIDFICTATISGLKQASSISGRRERANRHLAQLLILSMILGMKFSIANNLKASDH
jgi:hypothetical protein